MANVLRTFHLCRASNPRHIPSARRLITPYQRSRFFVRNIASSSTRCAVQPRCFPTDGFTLLPTDVKYEEERLIGYQAGDYYPVRLGEVFDDRYQIVAKLGFGTASTVWLCRDFQLSYLGWCYCRPNVNDYSGKMC